MPAEPSPPSDESRDCAGETAVDVAIVGAGAAGLMCAIQLARAAPPGARVLLLDGARKPGAKILVAGGGRCNVTHRSVHERDYCGGSANAIRRVLRRFDVDDTRQFFDELGVPLVEEEGGKLFPRSNRARSVLDALLGELRRCGVVLRPSSRVASLSRDQCGFRLFCADGSELRCRHLVLASGGCSMPKTGSDGGGHRLAQALGHRLVEPLSPALVPLLLPAGHWLRELAGLSASVTLQVQSANGKRLAACSGALLCTHFGISGPAVLDVSRHWLAARRADPAVRLRVDWLPAADDSQLGEELRGAARSVERWLAERLPARLAAQLCHCAGLPAGLRCDQLRREQRRALLQWLRDCALPACGDRGFKYAEVTAGGVALDEVGPRDMASRRCPGLYLCGELLDVDGRIGGFNFQWAWASGAVAGRALAERLRGAGQRVE